MTLLLLAVLLAVILFLGMAGGLAWAIVIKTYNLDCSINSVYKLYDVLRR